ncbi:MAG: PAS domain S-box protein, partial [Deltaproteobacteria bacterium]|nr:PAS domain S-box protein [Deltaproteobacteria bacterium]
MLVTMMIVLIALILFRLLQSMVTRHLKAIAWYFQGFELGKERQPLILDKQYRGDELDILADSFNKMSMERDKIYQELFSAQQETKASAVRFRDLLENAPFPIIIARMRDGIMRYANRRSEMKFHFKREHGIGLSANQFYQDPAERGRFLETLRRDVNVADQEMRLLNWQGKHYWALMSASLVEFENEPSIMVAINDITAAKEANLALERERSNLYTLIRAIPDLVWAKDLNGVYIACNPVFERLYGAKEEDILGKTVHDFSDQDTADARWEKDRWVIENRAPRTDEEWISFAADGYRGLFEVVRTPIFDISEKIIGYLGIGRDITESRRNQHQLGERIKEQKCLYEIFNISEDPALSTDEMIKRVVQAVAPGWQFPEITSVCIDWAGACFCTPGFSETSWMQTASASTQKGEIIKLTVAYREERPVEDDGPFLKEEGKLAQAIVYRLADVVDRRQSADKLKEREELIATMFAQTTDAIVLVDSVTGQFVDFNEAAHLGLGFTREEFSRLSVSDFQAEHSVEQISANTVNVTTGKPVDFETAHRHKDGTIRKVAVKLRSINLGGGTLISAVWRDITEQKARENALRELSDRFQLYNRLIGQINSAESAIVGEVEAFGGETTELLANSLGIGRVSIWLHSADETRLECLDIYEASAQIHSRGQKLKEEEFCRGINAHKHLRYVDINDTLTDPRTQCHAESYFKPLGITAMLDCSIISGGRILGSICFEHVNRQHQWKSDEIVFGCQVADQISMALINKDRVKAARALRQSELFLKRAQAVSLTGHWHLNIRRNELTWSDETYRMFDMAVGTPINFATFADCVHPDDRQRALDAWNQALAGHPYDINHRILVADQIRWVREKADIEFDESGQPLAALGIVQDVTMLVENEQRINRINRVYAMLSHTNEAIMFIRETGDLFQEICHIVVEVGRFQMAWIGKLDDAGNIKPMASACESPDCVEEQELCLSDDCPASRAFRSGTSQICNDIANEATVSPWSTGALERGYRSLAVFPIVIPGGKMVVLKVYSEIPNSFDEQQIELFKRLTDNIGFALEFAASQANAQKEGRFRKKLIDSVPALFLALNERTQALFWNKRFEEATQLSATEIVTKVAIDFFEGDDKALVTTRLKQASTEGEGSVEAELVAKDGNRTPYLFHARRIEMDEQPIFVITGMDITEKVKTERELEEYRLHLEE